MAGPDRASDRLAFWRGTYRSHAPTVLAFLVSRMQRREDAEDLLQETFVRAIQAESRIRDRSKVRPYLMSIAHNLVCNDGRRRKLARAAGVDDVNDLGPPDQQPPSSEASPEADAQFGELEGRLAAVLAGMKPRLRLAFELAVLGGYSYSNIAEQTGWTAAQVKINVYRARRSAIEGLRDLLPSTPEDGR